MWAWLLFFLGFMSCIVAAGDKSRGAVAFAGICWLAAFSLYIRARSGAWWNHG